MTAKMKDAIFKLSILFAVPMMPANQKQQLYSAVDRIAVGKCVGNGGCGVAAAGGTADFTAIFAMATADRFKSIVTGAGAEGLCFLLDILGDVGCISVYLLLFCVFVQGAQSYFGERRLLHVGACAD
ncbi:hypothetical protein H8S23_04285 [Anaerofilum sp. BX8]|uniref:Uncharacterized protein n=1 Tax=Anaerofilum hominis TaxID=2763016 RepID=A0A923L0L8_9FIRM|nr:hypothetical protein [Anaerofilum hominis]MBC5580715.1 hypothetical protein [Anaerofilum hominis]